MNQNEKTKSFLKAQWLDLLMLNWEIDPHILLPYLPRHTELDTWQGKTFISVVAFRFENTRVLGVPIPWHTHFEELNLRFYVVHKSGKEIRRGVVFIKELVPRYFIALVARLLYNENYHAVPMSHSVEKSINSASLSYSWIDQGKEEHISAQTTGEAEFPDHGSREEFITEHYWGYTKQQDGSTLEYRVAHPPWKVWQIGHVEYRCDVAQLYGSAFAAPLSQPPAFSILATGSDVMVFPGKNVG